MLAHVRFEEGARILDAGTGSGVVARVLAARYPTAEVVGVDLNPGYVAYARRLADAEGLRNLTSRSATCRSCRSRMRASTSSGRSTLLFFLPSADRALREFARVTRPGGQVMTVTQDRPMLNNFPEDPRLQPLMERFIAELIGGWECRRLPAMLRAAGLTEVDVRAGRPRRGGCSWRWPQGGELARRRDSRHTARHWGS